jgi:hypothetical protein
MKPPPVFFSSNERQLASPRRRRLTAAALAVALLGSGPLFAAPSVKPDVLPEPTPFSSIPSDVLQKMQAQAPLAEAAGVISAAVHAQAALTSGYAGIALEDQKVVLWWKGPQPRALQQALAKARRIGAIEVRPAAHSHKELRAAAEIVSRQMKADAASPVHTVDIAVDGSGLHLVTDRDVGEARAWLPAIGVPIELETRSAVQLTSRYHDTLPFWGGAAILNPEVGVRCTSGFAVTNGFTNYLLTAGHCGRPGGPWYNGDWSIQIGTASAENVAHDLLLIPTISGGRIYDGGVGVGEFSKGVAGWNWVYANEWVCQSGSTSGAVCGIQNTSDFTYSFCAVDPYGHRECYNDLILARRPDNGVAARPGDSGGPVFTLYGSARVVAKGTVTGVASDLFCSQCYLIYQDFGTAWRDFGIWPLTSY